MPWRDVSGSCSQFPTSKSRYLLQRRLDVIDGDEARALELPRRVLVPRTPHEVRVVETMMRIVPAAVAGVIVDHPIRRGEFVQRVREAADHHHRHADAPGEP